GRQDFVERSGLALRPQLAVGMTGVIDQLIFVAGRAAAFLRDEVLDAIVPAGLNAPFPAQLEVAELLLADDVAAAHALEFLEQAVLDLPAVTGSGLAAVSAPARKRLAVEEEFPAGG